MRLPRHLLRARWDLVWLWGALVAVVVCWACVTLQGSTATDASGASLDVTWDTKGPHPDAGAAPTIAVVLDAGPDAGVTLPRR